MLQAFILCLFKTCSPSGLWFHELKPADGSGNSSSYNKLPTTPTTVFHKLFPKCPKGAEFCLSKAIFQCKTCKTRRTSRAMESSAPGLFRRAPLFRHGSALARRVDVWFAFPTADADCSRIDLRRSPPIHIKCFETSIAQRMHGFKLQIEALSENRFTVLRLAPLKSSSICEKVHSFLAIGGLASRTQSNKGKSCG